MKINLTKLLLDINNKDFANFISILLLKKIGILKRDFIQNKSFQKKNGIHISTLNCMQFICKYIDSNLKIKYIENIDNIYKFKDFILYDFEICQYNFNETLLCILMQLNKEQNVIIIIDIINVFVTFVTNTKINSIDFGIKNTSKYFKEQKIYSLISNLIRFKKISDYKKNKYYKFFNQIFMPLYEKTYIQSG